MRIAGRRCIVLAAGLAALVAFAANARAQMSQEELKQKSLEERVSALEGKWSAPDFLRAYWKDGLKLETQDKNVQLAIGGRAHFDAEWNHADDDLEATKKSAAAGTSAGATTIGPLEDGWEVRRARLYFQGLIYQHVEFKLQFDLGKSTLSDKDVYIGLVNLGDYIPNFRAGHQFEPFGLETLTSDNELTFMEFSAVSNTLAPFRNPGMELWKNWKVGDVERLTWAAGVFRTDASDNGIGSGDGAYNLTGRITGLPIYEDGGQELVHVGADVSRRSIPGRTIGAVNTQKITYSANPESDLLQSLISTGAIPAEREMKYGLEALGIWGPASLQAEYIVDKISTSASANLNNPTFKGWYAQAAYTISGENRKYSLVEGVAKNPKPSANAFVNGGLGAWEVAARFDNLDLTHGTNGFGGIAGGSMDIGTLGLNWYLNPNCRIMWDLSRADVHTDDKSLGNGGMVDIFQMRVQIAF